MWRAPEFNNRYVFFTSAKFKTHSSIKIYKSMDGDGDGVYSWTVIKEIRIPEDGYYFWSPEPFIYKGKSYIFFISSQTPNHKSMRYPTDVLIADIMPGSNFLINLTKKFPKALRIDPEVFITEYGPCIYYNLYTLAEDEESESGFVRTDYSGIYKIFPGL